MIKYKRTNYEWERHTPGRLLFCYILLFYYIKASGIYYPSIVARKRHKQDGCGLEVLGKKVIDEEEDISH